MKRATNAVIEPIESRILLSYTVNSLADTNTSGTLRWAVNQVNTAGGDQTINFDPSLTSGGPVTINIATALSLNDTSGTVTIQGPVSNLTINTNGTGSDALSIGGSVILEQLVVDNYGTINWSGTALELDSSTYLNNESGGIVNDSGGDIGMNASTINNFSGATFTVSGNGNFAPTDIYGGFFQNYATLNYTASGTLTFEAKPFGAYSGDVVLDNYGTVTLSSGNLTLEGNGTNTGTIDDSAPNGTINIAIGAGTHAYGYDLEPGTSITASTISVTALLYITCNFNNTSTLVASGNGEIEINPYYTFANTGPIGNPSDHGIVEVIGNATIDDQGTVIKGNASAVSGTEIAERWYGLPSAGATYALNYSSDGSSYAYAAAGGAGADATSNRVTDYVVGGFARNTPYWLEATATNSSGGQFIYNSGSIQTLDLPDQTQRLQFLGFYSSPVGGTLEWAPSQADMGGYAMVDPFDMAAGLAARPGTGGLMLAGSAYGLEAQAMGMPFTNYDGSFPWAGHTTIFWNDDVATMFPPLAPESTAFTAWYAHFGPGNPNPSTSSDPIEYSTGTVQYSATDLTSNGFGEAFSLKRTWTPYSGWAGDQSFGNNMVALPSMIEVDSMDVPDASVPFTYDTVSGSVSAVFSASDVVSFDRDGSGNYVAEHYVPNALTDASGVFTLSNTTGEIYKFYDFSSSVPAGRQGKFISVTSPGGISTYVSSWNSDGTIAEIRRQNSSAVDSESWLFTRISSGENAGKVENVQLRRPNGGGGWTIVRQMQYAYYGSSDSNGSVGDLESASTLDSVGSVIGTTYYRYYLEGATGGFAHALKYVLNNEAYARCAAGVGDVNAATDAQIAPFATQYFVYDDQRRCVRHDVALMGGDASSTPGVGSYTYQYSTNPANPTDGSNVWTYKTIETLPDGNENVVYCNFRGDTMLMVFEDISDLGNSSLNGLQSGIFTKYDDVGRPIWVAQPSAVILPSSLATLESYPDLLNNTSGTHYQYLSDSSGRIDVTDYYGSTTASATVAAGVMSFVEDTKVQQGTQGVATTLSSADYYAVTDSAGATVYPIADVVQHGDGSDLRDTQYTYTWFSGTVQPSSQVEEAPLVSSSQNGPGTADVTDTFYDMYGNAIWVKDPDGFINYMTYDAATGAVAETIADVNTSLTSEFSGLPSGWTTPSGGGLNLITLDVVDGLGRTTKQTDPNANMTYTIYNDANHETRLYPGFNAGTGRTTGPIEISRTYYPAAGSGGFLYSESISSSATPHLTSGVPDGTETISAANIQSLSRDFANAAGQEAYSDEYSSLSGMTYSQPVSASGGLPSDLGVLGVNYYRTSYGFDVDGNIARLVEPTGTIDRNVYDSLGRIASKWVGTDDIPTTGVWSPGNTAGTNLVQIESDVYDNNGPGDGDLTQVTNHPGGSQPDRITQTAYDWRDRAVESESGIATGDTTTPRTISYTSYDNLNESIEEDTYDGTGVLVSSLGSTGGIPNAPTTSLLRSKVVSSYDDQGRVYLTQSYSVDQGETGGTAGTVGSSLNTNTFYDHRGNVVAVYAPGGLTTKDSYDGAGRLAKESQTDGGAMAAASLNWTNANSFSNDVVLSQMLYTYDGDGNVILTTDKERFDNDSNSSYGDLGGPSTSPNARVYYTSAYYDAASRQTASVEVGTNGGTAYTRPGSVPTRSDTALVTSYDYGADDMQSIAINGSPTGGTFKLVFGGQTTAAIAYNATAATVQTALQTLSGIGSGNVIVTGNTGGPYAIQFANSLGGVLQSAISASSSFTGGTSPSVSQASIILGGNVVLQESVMDPRGIVSRTDYDLMGRTVDTITGFVDGVPSNSNDQKTTYTYDGNGDVLTMTAVMPTGTNSQTTAYLYGVGSTVGTDLFSNDLLAKIEYPDPTTGSASTSASNDQTYGYDWLGEKKTFTDQNGSVHTYSYDPSGRMTLDAVTTLGSGVNGVVRALGFSYDTDGRPLQDTSYTDANPNSTYNLSSITFSGTTATATMGSSVYSVGSTVTISGASPSQYNGTFSVTGVSGNTFTYTMSSTPGANATGTMTVTSGVVNQDQFAYDGWGQVVKEYQGTSGAVNTSTTPSVQYVYTENAGGQNNDRLTQMVYVNGRILDYGYGNTEYPLTQITSSGTTATATMLANVYSVGNTITISGSSDSHYNGTFTITAVNTTSKTISFTVSTGGGTVTTAGMVVTSAGANLNNSISRVSYLMDQLGASAGVHLEEYTYLGLSAIVQMNRPEAHEELTYIKVTGDTSYHDDGGDGRYTGLDRFGRVSDQYWLNTSSSPNAIDRFQYGSDRDGNVLYKKNLLSGTFSELYHISSTISGDNNTAYDALGRMVGFRRGTLGASANNGGVLDVITAVNSTTGVTGNIKNYTLDAVGNQLTVSSDGTNTNRTVNSQNELTTVGTSTITYNNDGDMTTNSVGETLKYDAWNRLVFTSNGSLTMTFDAQGRMVTETGGSLLYYDLSGGMISVTIATQYVQYVRGLAYQNEIILRDRNADGNVSTGSYGIAGSDLEERVYDEQDANWNTTSLYRVSGTAGVVERIIYDPYGNPTTLTSAWASVTDTTWFWRPLFQGEYWLHEANVYIMGARDMDYSLGVWDQKDPAGYIGGMNNYVAMGNNPTSFVDPTGLMPDWLSNLLSSNAVGSVVNDNTASYAAGVGDTISGGITSHIRNATNTDAVNYNSSAYSYGVNTGVAYNTALMLVAPTAGCNVAKGLRIANGIINGVGAVENGANAYNAYRNGDYAKASGFLGLALIQTAGTIQSFGSNCFVAGTQVLLAVEDSEAVAEAGLGDAIVRYRTVIGGGALVAAGVLGYYTMSKSRRKQREDGDTANSDVTYNEEENCEPAWMPLVPASWRNEYHVRLLLWQQFVDLSVPNRCIAESLNGRW